MTIYILTVIFAFVWVAITGSGTLLNFIFGFFLSSAALWIVRGEMSAPSYWGRLRRVFSLILLFLKELALSAYKRSEEHTSELQSLMRTSYAVFCLKKK